LLLALLISKKREVEKTTTSYSNTPKAQSLGNF